MIRATLAFLFAALALQQAAAPAQHVVIISIDGLRPDAIEKAKAPTLQAMIKRGAWCAKAQTVFPSVTLPSHVSMLTGLDVKNHGVLHNDYRPGHLDKPTIFGMAKKAGKTTAMFFSKSKFHYLVAPDTVDHVVGVTSEKEQKVVDPDTAAGALAKSFAKHWDDQKPALTFIHIREPDSYGHWKGWMGEEYLAAVATSDAAVAAILEAIRKSGLEEKTVVIVTSDHGGKDKNHEEECPENRTIPWICAGPGVKAGTVIDRAVGTCDTTPTALAFLGIEIPKGLDGKTVDEVLKK